MTGPAKTPGRVAAAVLAAALAAAGCGDKRRYPVTGLVVFPDGQPATVLAGGSVSAEATDGSCALRGTIGPDARFTLGSLKETDGAPAGDYRAIITPSYKGMSPEDAVKTPPPIDPKYFRMDTSGLTFTVREGGPNTWTVTVTRPAGRGK